MEAFSNGAMWLTSCSISPCAVPSLSERRIIGAGRDSRITFGVEAGPKKLSPFATVVIPTHRLIEALIAMQSLLEGNEQLKAELLKGLGAVKNTVEKIGK